MQTISFADEIALAEPKICDSMVPHALWRLAAKGTCEVPTESKVATLTDTYDTALIGATDECTASIGARAAPLLG